MTTHANLAIFASGNGTNAEEIMEYFQYHSSIQVKLVLSNNESAFVLTRAQRRNIPVKFFDRKQFLDGTEIIDWLKHHQITHLVLAGFLWMIPVYLLQAFPHRIINIHPALLPKFGGKGMYGNKVHEAVKQAGEKETGITIHLVNEKYDEGKILFQASCEIAPADTAHDIAQKVHALEHAHFARVIEDWIMSQHQASDHSKRSDA